MPLEGAFGALGKGLGKVMENIPWAKQAELGKKATVFGDAASDALGEFFSVKSPTEDWVAKFGRAVSGQFDPSISQKSQETMKTIVDMVRNEGKLGAKTPRINEGKSIIESVWKRYNPSEKLFADAAPEQIAETIRQAATNAYRKSIGLTPVDTKPGMITSALNWSGAFMKEWWIAGLNNFYDL